MLLSCFAVESHSLSWDGVLLKGLCRHGGLCVWRVEEA